MKHIRKFEDVDFLSKLKSDKKNREDFELEIDKRNTEKLNKSVRPERKEDIVEKERKEIVQRVIDGLLRDLKNDSGFRSFKEELVMFLDEFPKE